MITRQGRIRSSIHPINEARVSWEDLSISTVGGEPYSVQKPLIIWVNAKDMACTDDSVRSILYPMPGDKKKKKIRNAGAGPLSESAV